MTKHHPDHHDLEVQEKWFAGALPHDDFQSTEYLKMRVEIEANERWLASFLVDQQTVPEGLRTAIRQDVVETQRLNRKRRVWSLAGATSGLAAMLGLVFLGTMRVETVQTGTEPEIDLVFETPADGEIDLELDEALMEVEALLASLDDASWDDMSDGL